MHLGPIARSHRTNRIQLAVLRDPLNYRYFRFPLKMHINEKRKDDEHHIQFLYFATNFKKEKWAYIHLQRMAT